MLIDVDLSTDYMTLDQINAEGCDQAPIHCLPDEILEVIFLIHIFKFVRNCRYNRTLATSQVCQRWRAVALNYRIIWSRIIDYDQHSPLWIEILLGRSGSTLIDVGGDSIFEPVRLQRPRATPILRSIFNLSDNLKTVSLCIRCDSWEHICLSFLRHPAPNLEFLYLNLTTSRSFPECRYPKPLFNNEAPCLRRLHLKNCLIDFSFSVLSNLTELSVRDSDATLKAVPSVAEWLRDLKNIPALRFLTLNNTISHLTEHEEPVVDLPHLALLTISTRFYSGISLIDHINIPPSCGIKFWFYPDPKITVALDGPKLLFFLSRQLTKWPQSCSDRYLQAKVLRGGNIHFGNYMGGHFQSYITQSDEVEAHSRHSNDPLFSLVIEVYPLEDSFTFFNQLLGLYGSTFSTTTTLDLWLDQESVDTATTNGFFPAFNSFNSFTNVKTLNLQEQSPLYLLPLFQHYSHPDHPPFPALQTLRLTGMEDKQGVMRSVFVTFLQKRAEAGIPLSEIELVRGYMSSQTANDISRIGNLKISLNSSKIGDLQVVSD
jgi:hypothetical protein